MHPIKHPKTQKEASVHGTRGVEAGGSLGDGMCYVVSSRPTWLQGGTVSKRKWREIRRGVREREGEGEGDEGGDT